MDTNHRPANQISSITAWLPRGWEFGLRSRAVLLRSRFGCRIVQILMNIINWIIRVWFLSFEYSNVFWSGCHVAIHLRPPQNGSRYYMYSNTSRGWMCFGPTSYIDNVLVFINLNFLCHLLVGSSEFMTATTAYYTLLLMHILYTTVTCHTCA